MSDLEFLRPDVQPSARDQQQAELSWLTRHDEGELAVDVYETDKAIFVKTAIAGISPEELSLVLNHDMLTIKGSRHQENTDENKNKYLCRECHWGAFSRTIILPSEVNTLKTKAIFKNGILVINLPKAKKGGKIKVKVEDE